MSDTPKTDTNEFTLFIGVHSVSIENVFQAFQFARQLERELNECSRIAAVRLDYIKQLTTEKEAANDRIKQLEDRIHRAAMAFFRDGSDGQVASGMLVILEEERNKP
jgi:transcription elongation GreA/GreB family factor